MKPIQSHLARHLSGLGIAMAALSTNDAAHAQQLVVSTAVESHLSGPGPLVVFGDVAAEWDHLVPTYIAPTVPHVLNPHDVQLLGRDLALAPNAENPWVDLIDIPSGTSAGHFRPGGAGDTHYSGSGTAALNPSGSHVLLAPGSRFTAADRSIVWVVPLPLSNASVASHVLTLPGTLGTAQTHAIVFDPDNGRAYIGHSTGITAVDPPYTDANIVFTLALAAVTDPNFALGRALALSPDKQVLLSTASLAGRPATIVHAPFSATSSSEDLTLTHAKWLDGAAFLPDGSKLLIVDSRTPDDAPYQAQVFAIAAPYSANSSVERLLLPIHATTNGFEDIALSADGQFAALVGGTLNQTDALILIRAPFTAAQFTSRLILLAPVGLPYGAPGRGAGAAEFWNEAVSLQPQLTIDRASVTEGNSGIASMQFRVSLTKASALPISVNYATSNGTAIAGTDYVATNGTLNFPPGTTTRTFTVNAIGNTSQQSDRKFRVLLSTPSNALVLQTPESRDGEGLILDDDNVNMPLITTDSPLPDAIIGRPYALPPLEVVHLSATPPNSIRWTRPDPVGNPPGLNLGLFTGVFSGTPTTAGSYYFHIKAQGDFPTSTVREFHLTVREDLSLFADGFE